MARDFGTVRAVRRRRNGVLEIRRAPRWRRVCVTAAGAAVVALPFLFALSFVLPPWLILAPTGIVALVLWIVFRTRKTLRHAPLASPGRVVTLWPARARTRLPTRPRDERRP